jgi:biopolymer transport protein ExbD
MRQRGLSYFEVDKPRIEVIPMIDIMMFLLVFFIIITMRMISGTGIQLDLPSSQTTVELKPTQITIGVQKDHSLYVDGERLSDAELTAKLSAATKENKVDVVIAGDKEVSLQTLLDVMDIVRGVGINSVGIAATAKPAELKANPVR